MGDEPPGWLADLDEGYRALVVPEEHPRKLLPQLAIADDGRPRDTDIYERKLDGMRFIVHLEDGRIELRTRTHEERSRGFPELVDAVRQLGPRDLVADGEVVAFDGSATSFSRLQGRMGLNDPVRARLTGIVVHLYLFDLLHLDGYSLRALPLRARKDLLQRACRFVEPVRVTPDRTGDPKVLLAEACSQGWEGLIAKDPDAAYRSGRSSSWRKLKCQREGDFVIGGWTEPRGARSGFGALLLGYHDGGQLRYAGKVGTGFGEAVLARMAAALATIEVPASPFVDPPRERGVHWVEPRLVASIAYTEWTHDDRLRHPRFQGLRADKRPEDVVRDPRPS